MVLKYFGIQEGGSPLHFVLFIRGPWERTREKSGWETDIIGHIWMMGPYLGFPQRQSLQQMPIFNSGVASPEEQERGAEEEEGQMGGGWTSSGHSSISSS